MYLVMSLTEWDTFLFYFCLDEKMIISVGYKFAFLNVRSYLDLKFLEIYSYNLKM